MDLSVLIPARNEEWLGRTVADVLEHATANTEVIVVLDGAWPMEPLPQHPRLTVIYHPTPVGQRAATNEAARVARGRYVMKVDAHCAFPPGFDSALLAAAAELPRETLQVPLQRNLHVFDLVCSACGWTDYQGPMPSACPSCQATGTVGKRVVWKPRRGTKTTAWHFDADLHFQYFSDFTRRPAGQGELTPTMSLLGACWFLERAWFLDELEGLDERHGSWGQMGTELACKAWLSGGQVICNQRTWFAHLFRTRADFGFPYPMSGADQARAREYSQRLWRTAQWPKAKHGLGWLVDKFWPVPGWTEAQRAALNTFTREELQAIAAPRPRLPLGLDPGDTAEYSPSPGAPAGIVAVRSAHTSASVVYYSDSRGDATILRACRSALRRAAHHLGIIAVTLPYRPAADGVGLVDLHDDSFGSVEHVVLPLERGYLTMARQILTGLRLAETDVVFLAEHDVLYPPSHFLHRPTSAQVYAYAGHTWKVDAVSGRALTYEMQQLSGLCADRRLLIDHFQRRVDRIAREGFSRRMGFEPGKPVRHGGLDDVPRETWHDPVPLVDIRHGHNLTPSRWRKDQFRNPRYTAGWTEAEEIPSWGRTAGRFAEWLAEVTR